MWREAGYVITSNEESETEKKIVLSFSKPKFNLVHHILFHLVLGFFFFFFLPLSEIENAVFWIILGASKIHLWQKGKKDTKKTVAKLLTLILWSWYQTTNFTDAWGGKQTSINPFEFAFDKFMCRFLHRKWKKEGEWKEIHTARKQKHNKKNDNERINADKNWFLSLSQCMIYTCVCVWMNLHFLMLVNYHMRSVVFFSSINSPFDENRFETEYRAKNERAEEVMKQKNVYFSSNRPNTKSVLSIWILTFLYTAAAHTHFRSSISRDSVVNRLIEFLLVIKSYKIFFFSISLKLFFSLGRFIYSTHFFFVQQHTENCKRL